MMLLGNKDAHAKTSPSCTPRAAASSSPQRTTSCARSYPSLSASFAMAIGSAKNLQQLSREAWTTLAREVRVGFPFIRDRATELMQQVTEALDGLYDNLSRPPSTLGRNVYPARRRQRLTQSLAKVVRANCRAVKASFA